MSKLHTMLSIIHTNFNYLKNKRQYEKYEKSGIFDVNNIPERIFPPRVEWAPHNQYYGAERVLREYAGLHRPLNAFMEHGIQSKGQIEKTDILESGRRNFITFSQFRKEQYEQLIGDNRKVVVVGPYIKYSKPFYDEQEYRNIKERYGKVLTFFPLHTIYNMDASKYDPEFDCVIEQIEHYRRELGVDTVFICGYWRDYFVKRLERYKINGYVMVSAGHAMSQNFLPRLRSIIELSDYSMSDAIGTQVGYTIGLGVPHIVLSRDGHDLNSASGDYLNWILPVLSSYDQYGSKEQDEMMEYVFGIHQTKSPEELRESIL